MPYPLKEVEPRDLIEEIKTRLGAGRDLIVLAGDEFSVASGVPTVRDVVTYLRSCVARTVTELRSPVSERWSPRRGPWPSFEETLVSPLDVEALLALLRDHHDKQAPPVVNVTRYREFLVEAESAAKVDRMQPLLALLGRIEPPASDGPGLLPEPSPLVADSLLYFLTEGKVPNPAHHLLVQLVDPLRVRTVLTTNVDDLIEVVFNRRRHPIRVFEVHEASGLPAADLVLGQRSLIKANGGKNDLFSHGALDVFEESNASIFAKYFQRRCDLLILGNAQIDPGLLDLLQEVAKDPEFRVLWLSPHKIDPRQLSSPGRGTPIKIDVAHQPDLATFLMQLYQSVALCLPSGGGDIRAFPPLPPSPLSKDHRKPGFQEEVKRLVAAIEERTPKVVRYGGNGRGASSVAGEVFEKIVSPRNRCFWLDLDVYVDLSHMLADVVGCVSRALRGRQLTPMPILSLGAAIADLKTIVEASPHNECILFLNAREGLGTSASADSKASWDIKQLWPALDEICANVPRFRIVALYGKTAPPKKRPNRRSTTTEGELRLNDPGVIEVTLSEASTLLDKLLDGTQTEERRRRARFIAAACLCRRPIYPAQMASWGFLETNVFALADGDRDEQRYRWTDQRAMELVDAGLARRRPGGLIWIHHRIRHRLLEGLVGEEVQLAACHRGLADWYLKLFRATNDPDAALESIYHRLQSCRVLGDRSELHLKKAALLEAAGTLEQARDAIISRGHYPAIHRLGQEFDWQARLVGRVPGADQLSRELRLQIFQILRSFAVSATDFPTAEKYAENIKIRASAVGGGTRRYCEQSRKYQQAESLIGLRCYGAASKVLAEVFDNLVKHTTAAKLEELTEDGVRSEGKAFGALAAVNDQALHLAIGTARRLLFLRMLQARAQKHAGARGPEDGEFLRYQERAQRWYLFGAAIGRFERNKEDFRRDDVMLRVHASVNLANLHRFSEARRRLNEASAFLMRWTGPTPSGYWSVLALRRAEVFLREAEWSERGTVAFAQALREAYSAIQRARIDLLDSHVGIWWRTLACELELEIIALSIDAETPVLDASKTRAVEIYAEGERLIRMDRYRLSRLADLAHSILNGTADAADELREFSDRALVHLGKVKEKRTSLAKAYPLDPEVGAYVEAVEKRLESCKRAKAPPSNRPRPAPAIPGVPMSDWRGRIFISYGQPDKNFAFELHRYLEGRGIPTLYYPEHAPGGWKHHRVMNEFVKQCARMILICSKRSMKRKGLEYELDQILGRESAAGSKTFLVPITLDQHIKKWRPKRSDLAERVRERVVLDFLAGASDFEAKGDRLLEALGPLGRAGLPRLDGESPRDSVASTTSASKRSAERRKSPA